MTVQRVQTLGLIVALLVLGDLFLCGYERKNLLKQQLKMKMISQNARSRTIKWHG